MSRRPAPFAGCQAAKEMKKGLQKGCLKQVIESFERSGRCYRLRTSCRARYGSTLRCRSNFGWILDGELKGLRLEAAPGARSNTHVLPYEADGEKEEVSQDPSL